MAAGLLAWPTSSGAQPVEKAFSGVYAGAEAAMPNVIGGSLVDGVDTLQQETRGRFTLVVGGRYQFTAGC